MDMVLESKSEKGYWNNQMGWGTLELATIFTPRDFKFYPRSKGDDATLTLLVYAKQNRVDLD